MGSSVHGPVLRSACGDSKMIYTKYSIVCLSLFYFLAGCENLRNEAIRLRVISRYGKFQSYSGVYEEEGIYQGKTLSYKIKFRKPSSFWAQIILSEFSVPASRPACRLLSFHQFCHSCKGLANGNGQAERCAAK
jgi:hypothetical protein